MSLLVATDLLYKNLNPEQHVGDYVAYRKMTHGDDQYFSNYQPCRQLVQDAIIRRYLSTPMPMVSPWVIFTKGGFGAGKSHCLKQIHIAGVIDLQRYMYIDPDRIKYALPEAQEYIKSVEAGTLLHAESAYIAQLLQYLAFDHSYPVIIDGSMRDGVWYRFYLAWIREHYPQYRLGIISVTATLPVALARCQRRGQVTGRQIPETLIASSHDISNSNPNLYQDLVDFIIEIDNSLDHHPLDDRVIDTLRQRL